MAAVFRSLLGTLPPTGLEMVQNERVHQIDKKQRFKESEQEFKNISVSPPSTTNETTTVAETSTTVVAETWYQTHSPWDVTHMAVSAQTRPR